VILTIMPCPRFCITVPVDHRLPPPRRYCRHRVLEDVIDRTGGMHQRFVVKSGEASYGSHGSGLVYSSLRGLKLRRLLSRRVRLGVLCLTRGVGEGTNGRRSLALDVTRRAQNGASPVQLHQATERPTHASISRLRCRSRAGLARPRSRCQIQPRHYLQT